MPEPRALLEERDYPRYVVFACVGGIGPVDGRKTPNYEFDRGELFEGGPGEPTKSFERGADESVEDFKARVIGSLPAVSKLPWTVVLSSPDIVTLPTPEPVQ